MNDIEKRDSDADIEKDAFDEIFFAKHGVGHDPVDKEEQNLRSTLDNSNPTYKEIMFVRAFFKEGNLTDAYIKTFDYQGDEMSRDSFNAAANRLINRPRVLRKLNELRKRLQEAEDEDMGKLVSELNEDRRLARSLGQPGAAIQAVKAKASILGLDASANKQNLTVNLDLSDDQKRNLLSRISGRLMPKIEKDGAVDADFEEI